MDQKLTPENIAYLEAEGWAPTRTQDGATVLLPTTMAGKEPGTSYVPALVCLGLQIDYEGGVFDDFARQLSAELGRDVLLVRSGDLRPQVLVQNADDQGRPFSDWSEGVDAAAAMAKRLKRIASKAGLKHTFTDVDCRGGPAFIVTDAARPDSDVRSCSGRFTRGPERRGRQPCG